MRLEWVGDGSATPQVDQRVEGATITDFAYGATETLLQTEPRLQTIATLVRMAGPLTEAQWREVGVLVSVLLGPGRRVPLLVPQTGETLSVMPLLSGEVTWLRFMTALKAMSGQKVAR